VRKYLLLAGGFLLLLGLLLLPTTLTQTSNGFSVDIISEKHDLAEHEAIFRIQNLDNSSRDFNLTVLINNTDFDPSKIKDLTIYEYKPVPKEFPVYVEENVTVNHTVDLTVETNFTLPSNCWWVDNSTPSNATCSCNETVTVQNGTVTKNVLDWSPIDTYTFVYPDEVLSNHVNLTIPSYGSECLLDDLNNSYDCNGTKLLKVTWETPIGLNGGGWGSKGYYAIIDANTGISYDPWWNIAWKYRRNITINNTGNSNTLTDYQVAINLTYNTHMQPDFSDIRFTWYNATDGTEKVIPYWIQPLVAYNTNDLTISAGGSGTYTLNLPGSPVGGGSIFIGHNGTATTLQISVNGVSVGSFTTSSTTPTAIGFNVSNLGSSNTISIKNTGSADITLYYIRAEYFNATQTFWVKVPSIPASGYATVYVYYGNTTPVGWATNEDATMLWQDEDFQKGWTVEGSNGLGIHTASAMARRYLYLDGGYTWDYDEDTATISTSFSSNDIKIHGLIKIYSWNGRGGSNGRGMWVVTVTDGTNTWYLNYYTSLGVTYSDSAPNYYFLLSTTDPSIAQSEETVPYTEFFRSLRSDLVSKGVFPGPTLTVTGLKYSTYKSAPGTGGGGSTDNLFFVKYTSPDPTYTIGSEETTPPPTYLQVTPNYNAVNFGILNANTTDNPASNQELGIYNFTINASTNYTVSVYGNDFSSQFSISNLKFQATDSTANLNVTNAITLNTTSQTAGTFSSSVSTLYHAYWLTVPKNTPAGNYSTTVYIDISLA